MLLAEIVPVTSDMVARIALIGGVAGAAAVLGFSVWSYVAAKNKADEALDGGPHYDGEANAWYDEDGNPRSARDIARYMDEFEDD